MTRISNKKGLVRCFAYMLLQRLGYITESNYRKPAKKVYISLFTFIAATLVFAYASVVDDLFDDAFSYIGGLLRFSASFTVIFSAVYKKEKRRHEINREKNRRHLKNTNRVPVLNENVYDIPFWTEIVSLCVYIIALMICTFIKNSDLSIALYKGLTIGQAVINLLFSLIEIVSDFYEMRDYSYTYTGG